jgi:hypothetical protein
MIFKFVVLMQKIRNKDIELLGVINYQAAALLDVLGRANSLFGVIAK